MKNRLSILFIGTQMAVGGAQKVLLDQAGWFKSHGHNVTAAFFYDKEGLHNKWLKSFDFPIINLGLIKKDVSGVWKILSLINGLYRLWDFLSRGKFDVIETFTPDSNILALPFAKLAGIHVSLATHHGMIEGVPIWRKKLHSWIINVGIANNLVAVSNLTRQNAINEGVKAEHIKVITNGIVPFELSKTNKTAVRNEIGLGNNDIFLLSVGRLVYPKGHEFLIKALPAVISIFPNVKVGICGEGILRPQLVDQIKKLCLEDFVILFGQCDNVARVLSAADIFVLPSRWEGMPIALLEAMSAGLPVIATRVEGVEDVVVDGKHGLLVSPENPGELTEAIINLIKNPILRLEMGELARQRIEQLYTIDHMCEQYLDTMMSYFGNKDN